MYTYMVKIFGKCILLHFYYKSRTKKCWIWNYSNVSPFSFLLPSIKRNSSKTVCEMSFIVLVMELVTLFVFVFKGNWHVPVFFLIRRPGKPYGDSGTNCPNLLKSDTITLCQSAGADYTHHMDLSPLYLKIFHQAWITVWAKTGFSFLSTVSTFN